MYDCLEDSTMFYVLMIERDESYRTKISYPEEKRMKPTAAAAEEQKILA
jgi:hypothetical protein